MTFRRRHKNKREKHKKGKTVKDNREGHLRRKAKVKKKKTSKKEGQMVRTK